MSYLSVLETLRSKGIKLNLDVGGNLKAIGPKEQLDADLLLQLKENKADLLAWLREEPQLVRPKITPLVRHSNRLPTSFAQQRLWFIDQLGGGSPQYNMPGAMEIEGEFDEDIAEEALRRIIARHEPLRTVFVTQGAEALQLIREEVDFTLGRVDLSGLDEEAQQAEVRDAVNADAVKAFDLRRDLMLRASFLRLSDRRGVLLFNIHHIASDGWSMGILISEFGIQYEAAAAGKPDPLPALAIRYSDYAHWQREWLEGEVLERQLSYWEGQLADLPQVHSLPLDRPRTRSQSFNGAIHGFRLEGAAMAALKRLALSEGATLFIMLQGAFALLLSRYSNSSDIVMGTPVANRLQKELEGLVGFFINTLVLRADCSSSLTFRRFLGRIRAMNLDAQANQDVPFEYLVERLHPVRSTQHTPLFQIVFSMDTNEVSDTQQSDWSLRPLASDEVMVKFELTLNAVESDEGIYFSFVYNRDLFEASTMERMGVHLCRLLRGIAADPDCRVHALPMLSEAERRRLLHEFNHSALNSPQNGSVLDLFERQVAQDASAPALHFKDQTLSYGQLNARANQVAHHLIRCGVGPDVLVGLCAQRSLEMVIGILGILKAGGAYLPLDPYYPEARLSYMLEDSAAQLVLTQRAVLESLPGLQAQAVLLDEPETFADSPQTNPKTEGLSPSQLAYVIYTSGSTGRPKGVMVEHHSLMNLAANWASQQPKRIGSGAWGWVASFAFDASINAFAELALGRALAVVGEDDKQDAAAMKALIEKHHLGVLDCTPSLLEVWFALGLESVLPDLVIGGEPISGALWTRLTAWQKSLGRVALNVYGPTECCVNSTWCEITGVVPHIGQPFMNTQAHVVDGQGGLAPIGCAGELCIGGECVARGYLKRSQLTAERFVSDPYSPDPQARLYRTGDLVRWLANGTLEFIGRVDDQVKIRGFRIELGEVEAQIRRLEAVRSAVVLAREDVPGDKRLVAYVTLGEPGDDSEQVSEMRAALRGVLPEYMLPAAILVLDELPLTANGKVDRRALPAPDTALLSGEYLAPSTETEIALAGIWAGLLGLEAERISARANFFELGGHSLLSVRLVAEVRAQLDVELSIRDVFEAPHLAELAQLAVLSRDRARRVPVRRVERSGNRLPTSFAQQRLWFIDQLGGGSPQYNMPGAMEIEGEFDEAIAEEALRRIIARHEPLRTVFVNEGSETLQWIRQEVDFTLSRVDLSGLDERAQEAAVRAAVNADAVKAFDLRQDLMLRASFLRLSPRRGVLLFNLHHIASDGWSMGILINEFGLQYEAIAAGKPDPLPELQIRYADYAHWQREWLEGEVLDRQLAYWQEQLADLPQVHSLPLDRSRPRLQSFRGAMQGFRLEQQTQAALKRLALNQGATPFMLLQGAFALLLSRYGNSSDIAIGTPVANRLQKELEGLVGFFVNALVLRTDCSTDVTFSEFLGRIRAMNLDAQANQDVPFEYLVERLQPARSTRHTPLFQIVFSMDTNEASGTQLSDWSLRPLGSDEVMVKFDMTLNAVEAEDGIYFRFVYNRDLFDAPTLARMGAHLCRLLRGIAADPESGIHGLPMLGQAERQHLLHEFNDSAARFSQDICVHKLFEAQDASAPALIHGEETLSYGELNARANRLAHFLIERGVGPDALVGLCAQRSLEMVIGILGILKAGGAYLPLDPSYPEARLSYMLEDSQAQLVLTQRAVLERLPMLQAQAVLLDEPEAFAQGPDTNPQVQGLSPSHLAYVIYTSGSTGQPKGVMVQHRSLLNLAANWASELPRQIGRGAWGWVASFAFDGSVKGLAELLQGRTLAVIDEGDKQDAAAMRALIERHGLGLLDCTPSLLEAWFALGLESVLPDLVIGGEPISRALWARLAAWQERCGRVALNVYGPTECCVNSTWCQVEGDVPHIGRPLKNTRSHVVDTHGRLAPIGCAGELSIGGAGVARGYLNRAGLTAQRFVADPFSGAAQARLYRTGDLVRRMADGTIEFIGRIDDQVKVRGFRIELGEIESQLLKLETVQSAIVVVREDVPGDQRVVAYLTLGEPRDDSEQASQIRTELRRVLPEYMVPGAILVLDKLPLTTNGKVDRRALPAPDRSLLGGEYRAPSTETEVALAGIWARLLSLEAERISAGANFFELGGHSLLSVRLVAEVRTQLDVELSIRDVFEAPQLSDLAELVLLSRDRVRRVPVTRVERSSNRLPTSFAQQRLWFIDQMGGGSPQYNMPGAMEIEGDFDEDIAEEALRRIIARHEPLRTVFVNQGADALQWIRQEVDFTLERLDLSGLDEQAQETAVMAAVNADAVKAFDLRQDLMLRASFLRLSPRRGVLLFNLHHIASDGWSMGILINEFGLQYEAAAAGKPDPLPELQIRYADYAHWQREWLEGEVLERQLAYWQEQLADLPQVHNLPLDRSRPPLQSFNGAVHGFRLEQATQAALKRLALNEGTTLFMLLQGAFALLLSRYSNSSDIAIGTPVANRLQKELEELVGFFVNTLVLRADCSADVTFSDYLRRIRAMNLDAQANQDVPFEYLVERLQPARSTRHSPLFQIVFSMDTNEVSETNLSDWSLRPLGSDEVLVKFELTLNAVEAEDGVYFRFAYNRDLFDAPTIARLGVHLSALLRSIAADPGCEVHSLPMLSDAERQQLLHEFNHSAADFPQACLHELFEAQVSLDAAAPALIHQDETLSYGELNARANQVAHYLVERGVGPDQLVGLCAERSLEMVVGILGILKAGGAYVPLDPAYPEARLGYMLEDSAAQLVLTQRALLERLPLLEAQAVPLDEPEAFADYPRANPEVKGLSPSHLAYVIYTSGSTGRPKGVMVEQLSVVRLISAPQYMPLDRDTVFLQASSISFDAATLEIWGSLLNGGRLVLLAPGPLDLGIMTAEIERRGVNTLWLTAPLFAQWSHEAADPSPLRWILTGGDVVDPRAVRRVCQRLPEAVVINGYGPTENTTFTCCHSIPRRFDHTRPLPLGKAIKGTRNYVLSSRQRLAPVGVAGELCTAGAGVARGYLNQPRLTAERFIADPFTEDGNSRLYKTGDLVRWLADGNLEFLGRVDNQVKLRGFRIELGEIEHQLSSLPEVESALVLALDKESGNKRLVAYVCMQGDHDSREQAEALRAQLQTVLPEYMVPQAFVLMDEFPLTANGKVDKAKLPLPDYALAQGEYVAPYGEIETELTRIWAGLLGLEAERISARANFFELGGHSLLSVRLVAEVRAQLDIELSIREVFEAPQLSELAQLVALSRDRVRRVPVTRVERSGNRLPTSFAQQRLWFIDQMNNGSPQYNMPGARLIEGVFDEAVAEEALRRIVARHEPLRTVFVNEGAEALQLIREEVDFRLGRVDLSGLDERAQEAAVMAALNADAVKAFDLRQDLMLRASFLRLSERRGVLFFNMHHIASDGWSMGILFNEFGVQYEAASAGEPDPMPALPIRYADYAHWQREWLEGEVLEHQLAYWEEQLADLPQVHSLPLDRPRPRVQSFNGAMHGFRLEPETQAALKRLALNERATLFMLLQGAFALLLSRYGNSGDIVMGTPVANRLQKELEGLVGFFVNTLVLRSDCNADVTFPEFLGRIRTMNLDAQANQDVPFEYLVERLQPARSTRHTPLFQIMFAMDTNEAPEEQPSDWSLRPLGSDEVMVKFELTLNALESDEGIYFRFVYNRDLFDASTIARLGTHLSELLRGIATDPGGKAQSLPMLGESELQHLLQEFNDSAVDFPRDRCTHELFQAQVALNSSAPAVQFEDWTLSYGELNARANRVAHHLIERGVGPDVLVGLCVERSLEMVIGILGILKAGGAYLPLDPAYPEARLRYMLEDSATQLVLTQRALRERLPMLDARAVLLDQPEAFADCPEANPRIEGLSPLHLAYVIYTSGSTGQPKGVMVRHAGAVNLACSVRSLFEIEPRSRILQFSSLSFDAATWDWMMALANGATLDVCPQAVRASGRELSAYMASRAITQVTLPPALLPYLDGEREYAFEALIVGGEALESTQGWRWSARYRMFNAYGPTECTVCASVARVVPGQRISIGGPVNNTRLYVLDGQGEPLPIGAQGELHIGGAGVARGYLNRPSLSAQRFVADPFSGDRQARLYRTGDLVRRLADGSIEFIGRIDDQVKIRGFRIELGEIESQMSRLEAVRSAAVLAREDEPGDKRLVAYVTLSEPQESSEQALQIRAELHKVLPEYMVPGAIVVLDELPLTTNGKLDRRALPAPDGALPGGEYVAPSNEAEIALAGIWASLLGLEAERISAQANFFELGGHSLLSVRLVAEVRAQLDVELSIREVFEAPRLSQLAQMVVFSRNRARRVPVSRIERSSDRVPTSFAQQRLWFIDQMNGGSPQYNMPGARLIEGDFDEAVAEEALRRIIARHEPLRTVFVNEGAEAMQVIRQDVEFTLGRVDLSGLDKDAQEAVVRATLNADAVRAFDLRQDLMLRASFLRLSEQRGVLLFNMHHIASDGWSMGILFNEFGVQYEAAAAGEPDPMPALPIRYSDYAHWQREWLEGEVLDQQLDYWESQLADLPQVHSLPLDRPRPRLQSFNGAVHGFRLEQESLASLKRLALNKGATLFMLLQGAFALLLSRYGNSGDIVMGTPVANRLQKELEGLVGFFVNTLVLRSDCSADMTFREFLGRLRSLNLDAQANQDVPFEYLVERLKPARSTQHTPLFQIMFNMDTNEDSDEGQLSDWALRPVVSDEVMVKFELTLNAAEAEDGIYFSFVYNRDLFDAPTIARMGAQLCRLLRGIAVDPGCEAHALPMLSQAERQQLLHEFNRSAADFPQACLHELFEAQAARRASAPALQFGDQTLSYGEVNARANQVAHYLIERGVGPDMLVGLCAERSLEMVIGILGILKAGGAYVPLDPAYPEARLRFMLEDSAAKLVLTQRALLDRLPLPEGQAVLLDDPEAFGSSPKTNPQVEGLSPSHLAYVNYTSGSTGRPKGVMVEQLSVVRLVSAPDYLPLDRETVFLQASSISFDAATLEVWGSLLNGGRLVLLAPGPLDLGVMAAEIERTGVNTLWLTAPLFAQWSHEVSSPSPLRWILTGGDVVDPQAVRRVHQRLPEASVVNGYGPTENTTFTCCYPIPRGFDPSRPLPLGRAVKGTRNYVLSSRQALAPAGVAGELHTAGAGVARGYLNQPRLTAERFIADPFAEGGQSRLYKTGDLVRWLADGTLEFLGRADNQVKLRGFRVELGEIEHQLSSMPGVESALVLALDEGAGDKRLVGYVCLRGGNDAKGQAEALRAQLQNALPDYMVPQAFVLMDEFPLTANGKVDKAKLPLPDYALAQGEYVAPHGEAEAGLARIWAGLLGLEAGRISARANFFELGGHSLLSVRLVAEVRAQLGVELSIREVFEAPRLSDLAELVLLSRGRVRRVPVTRIERSGNRLPTSFAQQRLWFIDQMNGGSPQYNMPGARLIEGEFDEAAAEEALRRIVARHEPLRTVFVNEGAEALQVVREDADFMLGRVDLSGLDERAQETAVMAALNADAVKAFDLRQDLMLRASFLRLSERHGVLLFNMHHIASDGWSMGILFNEFGVQYEAAAAGEPDPMPALPIRYADYAHWQREWLEGEVLDGQLAYWEEQLAGLPQVHSLPLDRPRPRNQSFNGAVHGFRLEQETLASLKRLALSEGATLFMLLQGAFALLLSRYGNSGDIAMGTPVANRLQKELEGLVGFFVNTLVLRSDCSPDAPFREHLRRIRSMNLDAQTNQDVPFEYLVERLQPARSTRHSPLFQIVFNMDTNEASDTQPSDWSLRPLGSDQVMVKFDMTLNAMEADDGLYFSFVYNRDLFDASTMGRMGAHLCRLLRGIATDPGRQVHALPMLSEFERQHLLHEFNDSTADFPLDRCIHKLFEAHAEQNSSAQALIHREETLSYGELNARANRVAHHLIERGVGPDALVGLCAERSLEMVAGLLGILKAGGAYLPLDPSYPEARLGYMLKDSAAQLVLTQRAVLERLPMLQAQAVLLDESDAFAGSPETNPKVEGLSPSHLAYVIYTSGSTGQPKGVMVPHRAFMNLAANWAGEQPQQIGRGAWGWVASFAFDGSVKGLAELLQGRALAVISEGDKQDAAAMRALIERHGIGVLDCTPSLLEAWLALGLESVLPDLVIGGEPISRALWARLAAWQKRYGRVALNVYGPTECCVNSTWCAVGRDVPHIGRPLKNTRSHVVDARGRLAPIGCAGELCIGGAGVARGYLNRAGLTAQRFVADPFSGAAQARLYRTGDLVRRLADGSIEFIGRIDNQVKIRGFRIELGEIEAQIKRMESVRSAAVLVREDVPGDRRVVAYITLDEPGDESEQASHIRSDLRRVLPEYMVPGAILVLDELPLTANGKLDRRALPAPERAQLGAEYVAPQTETEIALAGIWARLLGLEAERISAQANFFELGGHSLLSVRLVAEVRTQLDVELSIRDVFEAPQLSELAELAVLNRDRVRRMPVSRVERSSDRLPTSFSQQRLWFIDQMNGGSPQYNMPGARLIEGDFNEAIAEEALRRIIARHEPLRTVFVNEGAEALQVIRQDVEFTLWRVDLRRLDEDAQEAVVRATLNADAVRAFDLRQDLMLRASFLRLSERRGVLLFNMHHIASDGWSMGILFNEFGVQYEAVAAGEPDPLPELPVRYADYAHWQREWLEGEVLDRQLDYWEDQLADLPQVHSLPLDRPRPRLQTFNGAAHGFRLEEQTQASLKRLALKEGATLFMLLQSAFALLLSRYGNSGDIVMGTPVANRLQKELEGLVGFFVNTLVLRADCSADATFSEFLRRIRATNLDAQANQDVPFEYLVERLQPVRSTSHSPLFQIMFSMDTNEDSDEGQLSDWSLRPLGSDELMVKFELTLNAVEAEDGLYFSLVYNRDLFDASTMKRMGDHLCRLLHEIAADAGRQLHSLPMLSEGERQHLLHEFNDSAADYPQACLHKLFEAQVARSPLAPALIHQDETLSYSELNVRANRLAHRLIKQGVGPDVLVGLCAERSLEMVVAILAILKAGGAYLPLDPAYPEARLRFMLEDSATRLVLTQRALLEILPLAEGKAVLLDGPEAFADCPEDNPQLEGLSTSHLAYLIYTSGSTGRPKGVMVEHHSLSNLIANWASQQPRQIGSGAWGWVASFAFDASVNALAELALGRPLAVIDEDDKQDPAAMTALIEKHDLGVLDCTPSLLEMWFAMGLESVLPDLAIGGEPISRALWARLAAWQKRYARVALNLYGPTECSVNCTWCEIEGDVPHIGRPFKNTQAHVVDGHGGLAAIGCPGELCIGGAGVARGYLNRAGLTAQRFAADPYSADPQARLYRTGDLVRRRADGTIEFIGRVDDQVKIRGFRIELGEIESQIRRLEAVQSAAVLAREDQPGDRRLVAYLTLCEPGDDTDQISRIRAQLRKVLPEYMLPGAILVLDELPLTANGKVDRRALPAPDGALLGGEHVAPSNETEIELVRIWATVLNLEAERLSVTSNFFDLGGHSLLATLLVSQMNQAFESDLAVIDLFRLGTVRDVAKELDGETAPLVSTAVPGAAGLFALKAGREAVAPLVLVHPVGGQVHCYAQLANTLSYPGTVYGIEASSDNGSPASIEAMAARYLRALAAAEPSGPYLLGGWSMGGVIAYEMACQLAASGDGPLGLIMIDSHCPRLLPDNLPDGDSVDIQPRLLGTMAAEMGISDASLSEDERAALQSKPLEELLQITLTLGKAQRRLPENFHLSELRQRFDLLARNEKAARAYIPDGYQGDVALLRAAENTRKDRDLGWASVAPQLKISEVPGNHFSLLRRPNLTHLKWAIDGLLPRLGQ